MTDKPAWISTSFRSYRYHPTDYVIFMPMWGLYVVYHRLKYVESFYSLKKAKKYVEVSHAMGVHDAKDSSSTAG